MQPVVDATTELQHAAIEEGIGRIDQIAHGSGHVQGGADRTTGVEGLQLRQSVRVVGKAGLEHRRADGGRFDCVDPYPVADLDAERPRETAECGLAGCIGREPCLGQLTVNAAHVHDRAAAGDQVGQQAAADGHRGEQIDGQAGLPVGGG